jgi:uncharacterized protein
MSLKILITGGSGLVGMRLSAMLEAKGHQVAHLSRGKGNKYPTYQWNIDRGWIDPAALQDTDVLIHLAGTGIADKPWTDAQKKSILHSRVASTQLLEQALSQGNHRVKTFVCASAIGYYGGDTGEEWISEQFTPGDDFLAEVTIAWEKAAQQVAALGIRTVRMRIGVVLSDRGGALPKIVQPIRWGVGAALGSGQQWMSWIHLDDLARMFVQAAENDSWVGAYNAVAPQPIRNGELTQHIAKQLGKILWLPKVPAFALKAALGEMSVVVLGGSYILNQRIRLETDFQYQFPQIEAALKDLLR